MEQTFKRAGSVWAVLLLWGRAAFAQSSGEMVSSFNGLLIGVSVLLVAVSFVFVMVKFARLIDVVSERFSHHQDASSKRED